MVKYLRSVFYGLYETISYYGIGEGEKPAVKDFIILINRYVVLCALIFVFHSFCNVMFMGITIDSIFLFIFSLILCLVRFIFKNSVKNKFLISAFLVFLTVIVTYYSSFCGVASGIYLFYFPLISCLPIFFSSEKDKIAIWSLLTVMLSTLYLSAFTNFTLVEKNPVLGNYDQKLLILNITSILMLLAVNFFFFFEKRADYFFILHRNTFKKEQIDDLRNEVARLKKILSKEDISESKIEELIGSVQLSDVIFIENFEKLFPDFFTRLKNIASVPLVISDLKLCAMLKLGFSTKQIAIYTNSTIKSVEGKKYRLRKKLNISPGNDSNTWMSAI